jgi:hypothetical protein
MEKLNGELVELLVNHVSNSYKISNFVFVLLKNTGQENGKLVMS